MKIKKDRLVEITLDDRVMVERTQKQTFRMLNLKDLITSLVDVIGNAQNGGRSDFLRSF